MKDYAEEELGVTGGEWSHDTRYQQLGCVSANDGANEDIVIATAQQIVPHDQEHRQVNARLLAASKDLYNVLRAIVDDGVRVSDYGKHWAEVDTAVLDEAEALLARLREATK